MSRGQISTEGVIFAKLPIELLLQIFFLSRNYREATALSSTCRYLRFVFETHFDSIYLGLAPQCLPCHEEATALARLQVQIATPQPETTEQYRSELTAAMRRNHTMIFRSARHSLARQNEFSDFKQAIDRPVEIERLPDELDEPCRMAIAVDYAINRLLIAPPKEREQILAEYSSVGRKRGTGGGVGLKRLQDSLTLRVYSYEPAEKELYLTTDTAVWGELLGQIFVRKITRFGMLAF